MRTVLALSLCAALPALASEDAIAVVTLQDAMTGATAMTTVAGAYLFIARPDGGYICGININDRFFSSLAQGAYENAFGNRPSAICVTARHARDLLDEDPEKL